MRTDLPTKRWGPGRYDVLFLKTTGTVTMTFSDEAPRIEWSGTVDKATGIVTLTGRRVDPYAVDRWADDGGRAP